MIILVVVAVGVIILTLLVIVILLLAADPVKDSITQASVSQTIIPEARPPEFGASLPRIGQQAPTLRHESPSPESAAIPDWLVDVIEGHLEPKASEQAAIQKLGESSPEVLRSGDMTGSILPHDPALQLMKVSRIEQLRQAAAEKQRPKTLAEQIEARLQYHLARSPAFASRLLHIWQGPDGGIQVEVDGRLYDGVSEVPDPDVRAFIQGVVQDWDAQADEELFRRQWGQ